MGVGHEPTGTVAMVLRVGIARRSRRAWWRSGRVLDRMVAWSYGGRRGWRHDRYSGRR